MQLGRSPGYGAGPSITGACGEEQAAPEQRIDLSFARMKSEAAGQLRAGRNVRLDARGTRVPVGC